MNRDIVFVHGTWGRPDLWHQPHSDVTREARGWGFNVYQFKWTGILGGVRALLKPVGAPALLDVGDPDEAHLGADQPEILLWLDVGEKLRAELRAAGLVRPHVLSHSHARQGVIMAAAKGQRFDTWVDVSGPVRADMERAHRAALGNYRRLVHYYDPINDTTIRKGQLFDGAIDLGVQCPHAHENIDTTGSGHTGLLLEPELRRRYKLWEQFADQVA